MMRKSKFVVFLVAMAFLGGCEETKKVLGQTKTPPDEFAVYSRAPLSLPPDYGLRPPAPGAGREQRIEPRNQAKRVILDNSGRQQSVRPNAANPPKGSAGVLALLQAAGALDVDPGIRDQINEETTFLAVEDVSFTDRLMFWGAKTQYGTVVDAPKESKRIRENLALGKPINEGDVPTIKRKRRALLEGLLD